MMLKKTGWALSRQKIIFGIGAGIVMLVAAIPIFSWQQMGQKRAESLARLHRLAYCALLYAQDWDGRIMAPARKLPNATWETWPEVLKAYISDSSTYENPANPVGGSGRPFKHPTLLYAVHTSYAMNRRFWDTFSPGPFPLENLEISGQTVLFVEAGPMKLNPRRPEASDNRDQPYALLDYGDTTDMINLLYPYPSTHAGKMAIAAADGHVALTKVFYYSAQDGRHDIMLGNIGNGIYNWNGGRANGETDRPAHE